MTALYLLAPGLAFLILGAHFYRSASFIAVAICIAMIALLFVRRAWAARTVQVALVLGALEWLRVTLALVAARQEMGAPFMRLALILGAVALLTALCAPILQTPRLKAYFGLAPAVRPASPSGTSG